MHREATRSPLHFVTSSSVPWARTSHMSACDCKEAVVSGVLRRKGGVDVCTGTSICRVPEIRSHWSPAKSKRGRRTIEKSPGRMDEAPKNHPN